MRTLRKASAAAIAAVMIIGAEQATASTCPSLLVLARACFAETTYPRSTPSQPAQYDRLTGFFSYLGQYGSNPDYAGIDEEWEIRRIRLIGGNAQRWILSWRGVQPSGTDPAFLDRPLGTVKDVDATTHVIAASDRRYLAALAAGIVPVISVYQTPSWARALDSGSAYNVPDLRAWEAFVRALAKRYPRAVLENYNEPNLATSDDPYQAIPAQRMAAMQVRMYHQVKAINPGQPAIGPALTNPGVAPAVWGIGPYAKALYAAGVKGRMDGFGLHPYGAGTVRTVGDLDSPTNLFTTSFDDVREAIAAAGDDVPIYVTELGASTSGAWAVADEAAQRDILVEMHRRIGAMPDVDAEIYFSLRDGASPRMSKTLSEYGLGWLRADQASQPDYEASPKPVYCAFVELAGNSYRGCATAASSASAGHRAVLGRRQRSGSARRRAARCRGARRAVRAGCRLGTGT